MEGWIKLHRSILEKPIWLASTPEQKTILITLLLMANHDEKEWEWEGKQFTCKPGQIITSLDSIQKHAGKSISIQNIRTSILRFEKYEFLTNQSTNRSRLITICNWEQYQTDIDEDVTTLEQPYDSRVTAVEQPCNTNKKDNNSKEYIYNLFYDSEILKSENNENYIKTVKLLFGENNLGVPLKSVLKMEVQLSYDQFKRLWYLKDKFKFSFTEIFESMENWGDLKKRKTIYNTFLTFAKKRNPEISVQC